MNTNTQAQDTVARLLATENLNIVRSNVKTACFDLKKRILTLPRWKEMTPVIEEMLMLHEVGHALFTSEEKFAIVFEEKKFIKDYANVIEDVRIEKKMKGLYPGARKPFNLGYRELNERDFFGIKNCDLDSLLLIDRINLYYKVGFNCGVTFNSAEYKFIHRSNNCDTEEEVIALAEEIYNFSKQKRQEEFNKRIDLPDEEDEDEDEDYGDEDDSENDGENDGDEDEDDDGDSSMYDQYPKEQDEETEDEVEDEDQRGDGSYSKPEERVSDKDLAPTTVDKFNNNLNQLADENLEINYYDVAFEYDLDSSKDVIIPYKRIIAETDCDTYEYQKEYSKKFRSDNSLLVNHLVKEFEMRKAATAYKRTKMSKLGQLDTRKLFAYKLKDDLFRQIMEVRDGKKHGMIFLLDWSGSMSRCMKDTIEQVVSLAMFCHRIQIPYQVFAFTDGYGQNASWEQYQATKNPNGIGGTQNFNLFEFFSDKMSKVEFNKMCDMLLTANYNRNRRYQLNATPLNEALLFMTNYIGKFIKNNQVEKMTLITLTDGQGGPLSSHTKRIRCGVSYYDNGKMVNVRSYLRDSVTKKEYNLSQYGSEQTTTLMNVIRDRYDIKTVGFYISNVSSSAIRTFVQYNINTNSNTSLTSWANKIIIDMRKTGFSILNCVSGRDEFYVLSSKTKIVDSTLKANSDMSNNQLAKALGNVFNSKKNSRIVLSRFIGIVA